MYYQGRQRGGRRVLDDCHGGAGLLGRGEERVPIPQRAAHRHEDAAVNDRARVVGDAGQALGQRAATLDQQPSAFQRGRDLLD